FLRFTATGAALTSASGWFDLVAAHAAGVGVKHKSCILLWMAGGPSQKDTFDMKPGTKDAGEFQPIATSVPGIQISEHFPKFAQTGDMQQFGQRVGLLEDLDAGFARTKNASIINDHRTTYQRAVTLMRTKEAKAFDLSREPASTRAAYGGTKFGDGCLLARRLVEAGIPFVEVFHGGWDTHADNFPQVKKLSREVDPALSTLIADLQVRGLFDNPLVI